MFSPEKAILVVIDIQGKLAEVVYDRDHTYRNVVGLIKLARYLEIPIILTEQVPDKIGPTIELISSQLADVAPIIKSSFSCCGEPKFIAELKKQKRQQVIICGIETHVCVCQTVEDLLARRYEVQVVADAVSSRKKENRDLALNRIDKMGATLTGIEMLATELMRTSKHPKFREILSLIK